MTALRPVIAALVAAAATFGAATAAQASDRPDVQWSVTIGSSLPALRLPLPVPVRVIPPPPVRVHPVVMVPRVVYREPTRWDADGDGIPNRVDRVYNPRWDVDGDGIPNGRDRRYDPRGGDRDHDGIPNRRDPNPGYPNHPGRGR